MFRLKKVTPLLVGVTVFAVLTAVGSATLFLTRESRAAAAVRAAQGTSPTRPDSSHPGPGPVDPNNPASDYGTTRPASGPGALPDDPGPSLPHGTVPSDTTPVAPGSTPLPESVTGDYGDPGDDPVGVRPDFDEFMALGFEGGGTWVYAATTGGIDDMVAFYMGRLNSGMWTLEELTPGYTSSTAQAPASWTMRATSPSAKAEVNIWENSLGVVQSQVTVLEHGAARPQGE